MTILRWACLIPFRIQQSNNAASISMWFAHTIIDNCQLSTPKDPPVRKYWGIFFVCEVFMLKHL